MIWIPVSLTIASATLLAASLAICIRLLLKGKPARARVTDRMNLAALLCLAAEFAWKSAQAGCPAVQTLGDSTLFFALVILAVHVVIARFAFTQLLTVVMVPPVIALQCASLLFGSSAQVDTRLLPGGCFLAVHLLLFLLSYALFLLAGAFGVLFLALDRVLRAKSYNSLFFSLPGLARLERLSYRSVLAGLVVLTFAMGLALVSYRRMVAGLASGSSAARPGLDFTMATTLVLWVYYALLPMLRYRLGWAGKRSCVLAIGGALLLLALYSTGKIVEGSRLHGFGGERAGAVSNRGADAK